MCFTKLRFFWILTSPDAKCGFHDLLATTKKNLVKIPVNHGALPVNKPVYKSGQISGSKFQPRFNPPFIYFPIKINSMIVLFVAARHFSFDFFYCWFIKKYSKRKFREIFQQTFSWIVNEVCREVYCESSFSIIENVIYNLGSGGCEFDNADLSFMWFHNKVTIAWLKIVTP